MVKVYADVTRASTVDGLCLLGRMSLKMGGKERELGWGTGGRVLNSGGAMLLREPCFRAGRVHLVAKKLQRRVLSRCDLEWACGRVGPVTPDRD